MKLAFSETPRQVFLRRGPYDSCKLKSKHYHIKADQSLSHDSAHCEKEAILVDTKH